MSEGLADVKGTSGPGDYHNCYNAGEQTGQQSSHFWVVSRRLYLVFVHLVILSLALLLQHNHRERQNLKLHLLPSELPFAKEAIRYEEVTFDPSGFWGDDSLGTPYEGGPTPEIDIKWNHLVRGKKISDPKYLMSRIIDFLVKLACIRSPRKNMTSWTLRQVLFRVRRMNT
ncbi:DUF3328 domain protein [Metarhizium robertsii]|uniref:DUF3328 domain protein n=1 Tax=Metarhizium robertsii TaxID=568076 RepID=A0A014MV82_9HYPO|nr:DUF3328 domain protein [Metarhizium robertsii]